MANSVTETDLKKRLRKKVWDGGHSWYLDLRTAEFHDLGKITVRDPAHPDWPKRGRAARTRAEAESWLPRFKEHLNKKLEVTATGAEDLQVSAASDQYVRALEETKGPRHNTTSNRRSTLNVHVKPALGQLTMASLTARRVRTLLADLKVTKRGGGEEWEEPASYRTKTNVRAAIQGLWKHHYPDTPPPFGSVEIENIEQRRKRERAAREGLALFELDRKAYSPAQILDILAHAVLQDRRNIIGMPNVSVRVIPNTAEAIAIQIGLGVRIHELCGMIWRFVYEDLGVAYIAGTKTINAPRYVPLQYSVLPWIHRLRDLNDDPETTDYLLQVDPRPGKKKHPSKKTYGGRMNRALRAAGLKIPQKRSHIFRATHTTWARAAGYPDERLEFWLGHAQARRGVLDAYTDPGVVAKLISEGDRTYLEALPSPAEVEERARELSALHSAADEEGPK